MAVECDLNVSTVPRILLIAYGNISRRDDGVAVHVIRRLQRRLGLPGGALDEDAAITLGEGIEALCLHQLEPELAETVAGFDVVVFIDAHVEGLPWAPVHWQELQPHYRPGLVSHHLKPEALLALCQLLYERLPRGYALSILGTDFDFGEELSPDTHARANEAVDRLLAFLAQGGRPVGPQGA